MKASIKIRLDKLDRRVPPIWEDLQSLILWAAEKPNPVEWDALVAGGRGRATPEQEAIMDAFYERNAPRCWAYWDTKYPHWQDAPFWKEVKEQDNESEL